MPTLTQGSAMASMSDGLGQQRRVLDADLAAAVGERHEVLDRRAPRR